MESRVTDADADVSSEPLALARYRRAHPSEGPSCLNHIEIYRIVQLVQRIGNEMHLIGLVSDTMYHYV